jgi:hypothetical protein
MGGAAVLLVVAAQWEAGGVNPALEFCSVKRIA